MTRDKATPAPECTPPRTPADHQRFLFDLQTARRYIQGDPAVGGGLPVTIAAFLTAASTTPPKPDELLIITEAQIDRLLPYVIDGLAEVAAANSDRPASSFLIDTFKHRFSIQLLALALFAARDQVEKELH
jgi:hypothetical protein